MGIAIPDEILASRAGRRLMVLVELVESRSRKPGKGFVDAFCDQTPGSARPQLNAALQRTVLDHAEETVLGTTWGPVTDGLASVYLTLDSGDRLALVARVTSIGSDSFAVPSIARIPAGVTVRTAVDADGPALREIERTTPMDFSGDAVIYDKGDDYFAQDRLKDQGTCFVIEVDGRPAGLFKIAQRRIMVAGEIRHLTYAHRHRVSPWAQGRGLHHLINFLTNAETPPGAIRYDLIRADHRLARNMSLDSSWPISPQRILIDTHAQARSKAPIGRPATPEDAPALVELLNDAHGKKTLYVPYTVQSLSARLSRLPSGYSWQHIRWTANAALGVWAADWLVTHTVHDRQVVARRAIVLDYGVREGAEDELINLISATCHQLATDGITELSLFTTPGDRVQAGLLDLAKETEPYRLIMPVPDSPDLSVHGIYVDQVYL